MPRSFAITAVSQTVELDVKGRAQVAVTVSNSSERAIKGWANLHVQGPTAASWFTIEPAGEHHFKPGESHQVTVRLAVPDGTPIGRHSFRLNIISGTKGSEEESTEGPEVSFEVRAPSVLPAPKQAPVFLLLLILAILLIAAVVGVFIVLTRPTPVLDFVGKSVQEAARWAAAEKRSLTSNLGEWNLEDLATNLHLIVADQAPKVPQGLSRGESLKLIFWKSAVARANGKFDFDAAHETEASTRSGPDFELLGMTNGLATIDVQGGARAALLQGPDNTNGLATLSLGSLGSLQLGLFTGVEHLALQPDDSFVLGGKGWVFDLTGGLREMSRPGGLREVSRFAYGRYDRNGRITAGGNFTREIVERTIFDSMMTVDGNGRVLMAECATNESVIRFTGASVEVGLRGRLRVSDNFPPSYASFASRMLAQSDDKLILGGGGDAFRLLRYSPEGRLDPQFGNAGIVETLLQGTSWGNVEVALGPEGSLTVARTTATLSPPTNHLRLIRYLANGSEEWSLTNAFIAPGAASGAQLNDNCSVHQLTVLANGEFLLVGQHSVSMSTNNPVRFLSRFRSDGLPDRTFGSNGVLALSSTNQANLESVRYAVAGDRRVTVAMQFQKIDLSRSTREVNFSTNSWTLVRFTAKGEPDPTFKADHVLSDTNLWKGKFDELIAMACQSDGKLLLVGRGATGVPSVNLRRTFVIRLNLDGTRDEKFASPYSPKEIILGQAAAAIAELGVIVVGAGDEIQWLSNGGRSALMRIDEIPAPGSGEMRFSYLTWTTQ